MTDSKVVGIVIFAMVFYVGGLIIVLILHFIHRRAVSAPFVLTLPTWPALDTEVVPALEVSTSHSTSSTAPTVSAMANLDNVSEQDITCAAL